MLQQTGSMFMKGRRALLRALCLLLCICAVPATAEKMNASIQEAIYRFEMKGETDEAIRILEKVATQGDTEDKENAYFHLGKIRELAGNHSLANIYYKQSLDIVKETDKAYWLSEREAATSNTSDVLIKNRINLRSPIKKIFSENSTTFIQLQNGVVKKFSADTVVDQRTGLDNSVDILKIDDSGIWFQSEDKDSLLYKPHNSKLPSRSYPIQATEEFFSRGDYAAAQNGHALTLLGKKGILSQINEEYSGCHIEDIYRVTGHLVLNCTDNALHFISQEDGSESFTISQFDAIRKVIVNGSDILLLSGNYLFCYQPKSGLAPRWKAAFSNAEDVIPFNGRIAVLEASGKISLLDKSSGLAISIVKSDAASIYPLAQGTLGLFSNEGALAVVDTLLHPLWHFNFAKPLSAPPIHTDGGIYLIFDDTHLMSIAPHYYGMRPLRSDLMTLKAASMAEAGAWKEISPLLDSLLQLEPGNAEAWLYRALMYETTNASEKDRQKAWSEAVRLSVSTLRTSNIILGRYSKTIGAKFVSLLNISPKTKYPQFFGSKKNLYTVDPAAERLICVNADNGELRWSRQLSKMADSPVMTSDDNSLVLASGFSINTYDLEKENPPQTLQLPGKAFNIQLTANAIYVATWNGFLLKINRAENRLAWSRKIYSTPFFFTQHESSIYAASLDGEVKYIVENSGQPEENTARLPGSVGQLVLADSSIAITSDNNRIYLFSAKDINKPPTQIIMDAPIVSLQTATFHDTQNILVGLADQSILLYSPSGAPLWKFQGKNSIFTKPYIADGLAWLDQGNEVVAIALKDGSTAHKFSTPGGAGTPFVMNRTLYSASSKRLLYAFQL